MKKYCRINNLIIITIFLFTLINCSVSEIKNYTEVKEMPDIDPGYVNVVLPPNIAPMNFFIKNDGVEYLVDIYGENETARHIKVNSKDGDILIPIRKWKKLLQKNSGKELYTDIYIKQDDKNWYKFSTITNKVANEKIDSYVSYRLINPGYVLWWKMGIYQRNIENFDESPIFTNRPTKKNCMNCHSYCKNNPDQMMFHMRADFGGTMLVNNGDVKKIDTKTDYTMSAGVYPSWHPDGEHIAFSVNKITQNFHAHRDESIFVKDGASDIVVYNLKTNTITTSPKISTKRLENLPVWSSDGKYLYYISGPQRMSITKYYDIKYDLMKISYDIKTGEWGEPETVLTAAETGKSITFPTPSFDGKYLIFVMSDYDYFTIHNKSSDLYIMDLENEQYRRLNINSDHVDSYHSWSINSRWITFVSKRKDELCSRLYFSYVDENGKVHRPILMPQKDPHFYETFITNYNRPEMMTGPVKTGYRKLIKVARNDALPVKFDEKVDVDALSGASKIENK